MPPGKLVSVWHTQPARFRRQWAYRRRFTPACSLVTRLFNNHPSLVGLLFSDLRNNRCASDERPVTRGHFRLEYGGTVSGCMDVNSAESAAGGFSVKSRLEELEEVRGMKKVEPHGNQCLLHQVWISYL